MCCIICNSRAWRRVHQPRNQSPTNSRTIGQVLSMQCLFHSNFHGELVFKTIGPLAVAAVIGSVHGMSRSEFVTTSRLWRHRSMRCTEYLLALAYFVLTPATNAAFRTFSCEVCMHVAPTTIASRVRLDQGAACYP